MEYNKYEMPNYNLHIIKTDKFKTITIKILFKRTIKEEEITIRNLLTEILIQTSKSYPTIRDMQIMKEDMYQLSLNDASSKSGNYVILSYAMQFLNEKYTEIGMNKKSIETFFDIILNPNVKDNHFDEKQFEFVKNGLRDYIIGVKDKPNTVAGLRFNEEMGKGTSLAYDLSGNLDELDKIDSYQLYDYYKSVIENDIIDIFIVGNIDNAKEIIENTDIRKNENSKSDIHQVELNCFKSEKVIKDKSNFIQSKLKIGFNIDKLTDFEKKYVMILFSFILGGGNSSKLFTEVREKNSLCYYINSSYSLLYNMLTISSGISKQNFDKAVKLIKEEFNKMQQGDFDEENINDVKKVYLNAYKNIYDSPDGIIDNYITQEYLECDDIETRINEIKRVTKEDIINVSKKIHLNLIYLLEGDK